MKFYFKESLIFIYVLIGSNIFERIFDLGFSVRGFCYVGLFVVCLSAIVVASYIQNNMLRGLYSLIIFGSSVFFLSYKYITCSFLTYNSFIALMNARGFAGEAFVQFYPSIVVSILVSLLLLVAVSLKPKYNRPTSNLPFIFYPIFVVFLLTAALFIRGGEGGRGLPAPFIPLVYSGLAIYEASNNVIGERSGVQIERCDRIINHDIILIIDESIAPAYLDINSKYGVLTNLKDTYEYIDIFNYGYAAAITNCSFETNLTLRYGGTRDNYLTIISTMPSIWQYAKKAELHTVYIDAQRTEMKLQNGMTDEEIRDIDDFIQFDDVPVVDRDIAVASKLIELVNNEEHDFVIVNKMGAHFPVHDKFPERFMVYEPSLPRGGFLDIADTGSREGFSGETDDWILYRNSYRNTLLWSVGHFFEEVFSKSNLNNAIIIYTSDHGQDLHESGRPGVHTHCSSNPIMEEGMVPLVVIQGDALKTLNWNHYLIVNKNKTSHYNIFPTLLSLMLYDSTQINAIYGNALNTLTNDDMTFNILFHARLGKKSAWKKINPNELTIPSECSPSQIP